MMVKRFVAAGLTVLLFWALVPALGEFFENTLHLAQEGHSAHASPDGDQHMPLDAEHGCTGAVHLCSCCLSLSFLTTQLATDAPVQIPGELEAIVSTHLPALAIGGVYHPPRA